METTESSGQYEIVGQVAAEDLQPNCDRVYVFPVIRGDEGYLREVYGSECYKKIVVNGTIVDKINDDAGDIVIIQSILALTFYDPILQDWFYYPAGTYFRIPLSPGEQFSEVKPLINSN